MRGPLAKLFLLSVLLPSAVAAEPVRISGWVLHPPQEVQVELRPFVVGFDEALITLAGKPVPPIASARLRPDGHYVLQAPESGFYSLILRVEGYVAVEHSLPFLVEETELSSVELQQAFPFEVQAIGTDGQPFSKAVIQAVPQKESDGWRAADRRAVTDAAGKAVFFRAEGEALALTVTAPGMYGVASTSPAGNAEVVRFPAPRSRTVKIRHGGELANGALVRLARHGWPFGVIGPDGQIPLPVPEKGEIGLIVEDSRGQRIEIVMTEEAGEGTDVPVVSLVTPTTTTGRILDVVTRDPVPGALVWNGGTAWTRAGRDGAFTLRAPSGTRGRVVAQAAGRMRYTERWRREKNEPVTLLLERSGTISGQVVDEVGKPIGNAKVTTLTHPANNRNVETENRETVTGADGRFVLRQVPAGRLHALVASLEGFAPARQLGDSTTPVRLTLRRGVTATGRVMDETGEPIAGAELRLTFIDNGLTAPLVVQPVRAVADKQGRFRFSNLSASRFELVATRSGFAPATLSGILIPEQEAPIDLGEITLSPGADIEGVVVDPSGKPIAEATVELSWFGAAGQPIEEPELARRPPVLTGADGRFRIPDLLRGRSFNLEVQHPLFVSLEVPWVKAPPEKPLKIELALARSLAGRVINSDGEPIAGAFIGLIETMDSHLGSVGLWRSFVGKSLVGTDEDGRFVLTGIKSGTIEIETFASGYRKRRLRGILIPEKGEAAPIEIALQPGTFLEGRLLDRRGLPIQGASVGIEHPGTEEHFVSVFADSDADGTFHLNDLEPGPLIVIANGNGEGPIARAAIEIRPGRNRLDLVADGGTEVAGTVVDASGAPVAGVRLTLLPFEPRQAAQAFQTQSSGDGSFLFPSVAEGEYRLSGMRTGFAMAELPGLVHVGGAPVGGLELRLGPGARIRGRILGLQPNDGRKVMVGARPQDGGMMLGGAVGPDGSYWISEVSPGGWHVVAHLTSGVLADGVAHVNVGDEEVVLDLQLPEGFTVSGTILLDGAPLAGTMITAALESEETATVRRASTVHDGTFRLDRMPPGSYTLVVLTPSGVDHTRKLEVSRDQEIAIEIPTGILEGRLLTAEGLPLAGAVVSATGDVQGIGSMFQNPTARTDDWGMFALPRLAAGTYKVTVEAEGFAPAEASAVVPPGRTVQIEIVLQGSMP